MRSNKNSDSKEKYETELNEKIDKIIRYVFVFDGENNEIMLKTYSADVFIGNKMDYIKHQDLLPYDIKFLFLYQLDNSEIRKFLFLDLNPSLQQKKQWFFSKHKQNRFYPKTVSEFLRAYEPLIDNIVIKNKYWENEIAWRISRTFELRNDPENIRIKEYQKEINRLIPAFLNSKQRMKFLEDIEWINAFVLPSIIELLQVGSKTSQLLGTILYDGFENHLVLKDRIEVLSHQHRMHPDISKFPREYIYKNQKLKDPKYIEQGAREWGYLSERKHFLWVDIRPGKKRVKGQAINIAEINATIKYLEEFIEYADKNGPIERQEKTYSVGILTFYKAQERELKKKIAQKLGVERSRWIVYETRKNKVKINIEICTVDRFQGKEADLILLSMVRTRGLGFIDSPNRLNVALTRAKYQLIVFGELSNFSRQTRSPIIQSLVSFVKEEGLIAKADLIKKT